MDPLDEWDYALPDERIAREPSAVRSKSRLMLLPRAGGETSDATFADLPSQLDPGDLLVVNDTRVMAARLFAERRTGAKVEVMLLEPGPGPVRAMLKPGRRIGDGEVLRLAKGGHVVVHGRDPADSTLFRVEIDRDPLTVMAEQGEMPLPPYLDRAAVDADRERYQTVFAGPIGAAAAPTAGLHFDAPVLAALADRNIGVQHITLHVGIGTFRPLRPEDLDRGRLHSEPFIIPPATAAAIRDTRARGHRVIAVGTTACRALEAATPPGERVPVAGAGSTDLFIRPGYAFAAIDGLLTNFHLPRSSLLMLVGALAGRERLLQAYSQAVERGYRFYSYGDAMLLV